MGSIRTFPIVESASWSALRAFCAGRFRRRPIDFQLDEAAQEAGQHSADRRITIANQRIWLDNLPEGFRSFRIVQLSDIHHSLFFRWIAWQAWWN